MLQYVDGVTGLSGAQLATALDAVRGRALSVGTGVVAAAAIYYTATNAASARRTAQAAHDGVEAARLGQRQTHELTERGQLTDRFTAAVAQLGASSPAVQLGGVHALAGLADDAGLADASRSWRQTCIDVLCAYLRLPYDPDPGFAPEDVDARKAYRALREVRHTVIRLIGNHLRKSTDDPTSWQGYDFDFTDVVFDGGDFHGAQFSGGRVDFNFAQFSGRTVDFGGARFGGATVTFRWAQFSGGTVDFGGAQFAVGTVDFGLADFSGSAIDFRQARFSGGTVDFGAQFSGGVVNFGGAQFAGGTVTFGGAVFAGGEVSFEGAHFGGDTVTFESAQFEGGNVNFTHALGSRPENLPIRAGAVMPETWLRYGETAPEQKPLPDSI
ncbi:pentapeptide repeat-containing protein [Streptosporangiaceae bacterium NEAU-GS5]|nr:pentapeptide repeat-containing protein [Streptosporangiaceae bacterium NEAU-GS5]